MTRRQALRLAGAVRRDAAMAYGRLVADRIIVTERAPAWTAKCKHCRAKFPPNPTVDVLVAHIEHEDGIRDDVAVERVLGGDAAVFPTLRKVERYAVAEAVRGGRGVDGLMRAGRFGDDSSAWKWVSRCINDGPDHA